MTMRENIENRLRERLATVYGVSIGGPPVLADAVLDALAEPTEAMVQAGVAAGGKAYEYSGSTQVCHPRISWEAMIAKAKEE